MPDSILANVLLFIPLFLVVNIVAAIPGRQDLRQVVRVGLRHFAMGSVALVVISALLYWLMEWLISHGPLW